MYCCLATQFLNFQRKGYLLKGIKSHLDANHGAKEKDDAENEAQLIIEVLKYI